MSVVLVCLFLLTATLYASVGFGGGSTYAAILSLAGIDYRLVPITALIFNITVVLGAAIRHHLANLTPIRRMLPFLIASVPAAYVGGRLPISEIVFTGVLGAALIVSGLNLLARNNEGDGAKTMRPRLAHLSLLIGSGIGFIAGLTGIGGGIFLAPILYWLRWGAPQQIAAGCTIFILVNSISGLIGQLTKAGTSEILIEIVAFWPLAAAVVIGGQFGTWATLRVLPANAVRNITAILVLVVGLRMTLKFVAGVL